MSEPGTPSCIMAQPQIGRAAAERRGGHNLPPGPRGYPAIGSFPFLRGDGLAKMVQYAKEYGDIFQYRSLHIPICFVNRPSYIEEVFVTKNHKFVHGRGAQANRRFLGRGLLTNEGDSWRHQRRVMQPAFHQGAIQRFASLMVERTEHMLSTWREGEAIDVYRRMGALTLDVVTRILFNVDFEGQLEEIASAVDALQMRNARGQMMVYALQYFPTLRNLRYLWTIGKVEKIVYRLIRQRRATGDYGDDLLSMLLQSRDENGDAMCERQIRDEVMTLIAGAYDTTALAISYGCYLLGEHPDAAAELAAELRSVAGDRPLRFEDLPNLPYLDSVIKETMRLYPPAPAMVREAIEDVEIGGYYLPKGASVILSPWITHRDARYFDAPEEFRPQRWTREFEKQLPKFAYFPFGGGSRKCIGSNLARMEAALILATVVRRIGMRPAPGFKLQVQACINLQPRNGIRMVLGRPFGWAAV